MLMLELVGALPVANEAFAQWYLDWTQRQK